MRITRIYHPGVLSLEQEVELESQAATHLTRVLRIQQGAELTLFNGDGFEYKARISRIHRHHAWAVIMDKQAIDNESPLNIRLVQGISKGERMDYTIQKAVELGVTHITPIFSEHGTGQLKADRLEKRLRHWQGIVSSACEQCGRNRVPLIDPPEKFEQWIQGCNDATMKLTLAPDASATLKTLDRHEQDIILLIGPEGGLSNDEITLSQQYGFKSIKLGPRVLRTETAAVTIISIIQSLWGDLA
jgi:16S rRNA (uracil1498-N3)-methyltransferase